MGLGDPVGWGTFDSWSVIVVCEGPTPEAVLTLLLLLVLPASPPLGADVGEGSAGAVGV